MPGKTNAVTEEVTVQSIKYVTQGNPTMTTSRGVPLALSINYFKSSFIIADDSVLIFILTEKQREFLREGMHGKLTYKGDKFIKFCNI